MKTPFTPGSLDPALVASRLGLCAAALAGAAAPQAHAVVITSSTPIPIPATTAGVYINFLTGATGTSAAAVPGWDFNPYLAGSGTQLGFYWGSLPTLGAGIRGGSVVATAGGPSLNLPVGAVVGPASIFNAGITSQTLNSPYLTSGVFTLGFRFHNEATNAINYGYLTMQTSATNGFPATILSYAYENNGSAITVVPEPSTGLMLTAGALALGAVQLRRRRKERAAAAAVH